MDPVLELLSKYNQECRHSETIQVSQYLQKPKSAELAKDTHPKHHASVRKGSRSAIYEIFRHHDPLLETIPNNERSHYFTGVITKLCTDIDEKTEECYDAFKFNPRAFKKSLIQSSLQEHAKNRLSSLLYLNEYFKRHFVIVVNDLYFETCPKPYPKEVLVYERGFYALKEHDLASCSQGHWDHIPLAHDVKPLIYQMPLGPIGKYKADELKQLCLENGISLKVGSKNKVKKQLYDELNLKLLS